MITVGLDLSLTHSGYTLVDSSGLLIASGVVRSKPVGDRPLAETQRLVEIAETLVQIIDKHLPDQNPDLVIIEGLAFMARNSSALVQLAGLNYLTRTLLREFAWPFLIVAPSTLKKFITGKGNSDKNIMMMTIYKDYGHEFMDDNVADAFALASVGLAVLGAPLNKLLKPQEEVVKLLKIQLP